MLEKIILALPWFRDHLSSQLSHNALLEKANQLLKERNELLKKIDEIEDWQKTPYAALKYFFPELDYCQEAPKDPFTLLDKDDIPGYLREINDAFTSSSFQSELKWFRQDLMATVLTCAGIQEEDKIHERALKQALLFILGLENRWKNLSFQFQQLKK